MRHRDRNFKTGLAILGNSQRDGLVWTVKPRAKRAKICTPFTVPKGKKGAPPPEDNRYVCTHMSCISLYISAVLGLCLDAPHPPCAKMAGDDSGQRKLVFLRKDSDPNM